MQTKFPFLKDMTITFLSANEVKVNLVFSEPELIIRNQNLRFGLFHGYVFPLYSGNTLGKGIEILDMPDYLSGSEAMSGLFYRLSAADLIQQVDLMYQ
jgi:hypothetical protein